MVPKCLPQKPAVESGRFHTPETGRGARCLSLPVQLVQLVQLMTASF